MLLRWFRFFSSVAMAVSLALVSPRADPLPDLGCKQPIRLAFYEFGTLFHQGVGIDRDVVDEIARRTACKFETQILPRNEIWQRLESGQLDMTTSGTETTSRAAFAYFIPYLGLKNVVVARHAEAAKISSFDDILARPDLRIGVVAGFLYGGYYDNRLQTPANQSQIRTYLDQQSLYLGLENDDVQVILTAAVNYEFYLSPDEREQRFAIADLSPAPPLPHAMVFARSRFTPAMINDWTRVLERMRLDGTLQRIYQRSLPPDIAVSLLTY
ncbi:MAG TPA: transporter substrate-binding domain-containing protein [Dongiaceae bacterium]|nr:transporter substrate-binding domain-containing protein [Dongiaceae bacterium]